MGLFILADIISCMEYNSDGDLLATGDKGGRVVIFQRDQAVSTTQKTQIGSLQNHFCWEILYCLSAISFNLWILQPKAYHDV